MRIHVPASEGVTSVAGVTPLRGRAAQTWDITGGTVPGFHLPPGRERKKLQPVVLATAVSAASAAAAAVSAGAATAPANDGGVVVTVSARAVCS